MSTEPNITALPGTDVGDQYRVRVRYDNVTNFSFTMGDTQSGGTAYYGIDFSLGPAFAKPLGSIGNFIWNDLNGNGAQDSGEPGLDGVQVYVDSNGNGSYDAGEPTDTTVNGGLYTIFGLVEGTYSVRINSATLPAGFAATYDLDGTATANVASVTLTAGQNRTDVDFGYQQRNASIGDRIWNDLNADGVQDAGEVGINGVTVFIDSNGNGSYDSGEPITTTAGDGNYSFSGLAAGTYSVRIAPATLPAGFAATYDLDGTATANVASVTLIAGQNRTDADFGYEPPRLLSGVVFRDNGLGAGTRADGIQTAPEPNADLAGMSVVILDQTGKVLAVAAVCTTGAVLPAYCLTHASGYWETPIPAGTGYTAYVTTAPPNVGDLVATPAPGLPGGWTNTNENIDSGTPAGTGDGIVTAITPALNGLTTVNFGIIRNSCPIPGP